LYCINLAKDMDKWRGYCERSNETVYSIKCGEFPREQVSAFDWFLWQASSGLESCYSLLRKVLRLLEVKCLVTVLPTEQCW
jgi:hypothetical protein